LRTTDNNTPAWTDPSVRRKTGDRLSFPSCCSPFSRFTPSPPTPNQAHPPCVPSVITKTFHHPTSSLPRHDADPANKQTNTPFFKRVSEAPGVQTARVAPSPAPSPSPDPDAGGPSRGPCARPHGAVALAGHRGGPALSIAGTAATAAPWTDAGGPWLRPPSQAVSPVVLAIVTVLRVLRVRGVPGIPIARRFVLPVVVRVLFHFVPPGVVGAGRGVRTVVGPTSSRVALCW